MTLEERAGHIADMAQNRHPDWSFEPWVLDQLKAAIAEEREAVSALIDRLIISGTPSGAIFAAIRARHAL